ncbi:MAG: hypothetical protein WA322_26390 [Pseudolabrys sp.]
MSVSILKRACGHGRGKAQPQNDGGDGVLKRRPARPEDEYMWFNLSAAQGREGVARRVRCIDLFPGGLRNLVTQK